MFKFIPRYVIRNCNCLKQKFYCTVKSIENTEPSVVSTKLSLTQKWISFWKTLFKDYKDVLVDTGKQMKDHPMKASVWLSIFSGVFTCCAFNPDEASFRTQVIAKSNELIFVGKGIRNPSSEEYLKTIEFCNNYDQLRRISFGIFCIILRDFKCSSSGIYKDNCSFTQPTYYELILNHIVDIGFWNKWWILERKMIDYDVNDNEWS